MQSNPSYTRFNRRENKSIILFPIHEKKTAKEFKRIDLKALIAL